MISELISLTVTKWIPPDVRNNGPHLWPRVWQFNLKIWNGLDLQSSSAFWENICGPETHLSLVVWRSRCSTGADPGLRLCSRTGRLPSVRPTRWCREIWEMKKKSFPLRIFFSGRKWKKELLDKVVLWCFVRVWAEDDIRVLEEKSLKQQWCNFMSTLVRDFVKNRDCLSETLTTWTLKWCYLCSTFITKTLFS